MNWQNFATVAVGGLFTIAPQLITVFPPAYKDVASGVLAMAFSIWHLYQPAPAAPTK